jgi:hypothetical protein
VVRNRERKVGGWRRELGREEDARVSGAPRWGLKGGEKWDGWSGAADVGKEHASCVPRSGRRQR